MDSKSEAHSLLALAIKGARVLVEILGYLRQWEKESADLSHLRQCSAMMENCHNTSSPWWQPDWEPETPTGPKLRYSFKIKTHPLSPLSSLSIMARKQSNAFIFYQVNQLQQFPQVIIKPKEQLLPLWTYPEGWNSQKTNLFGQYN